MHYVVRIYVRKLLNTALADVRSSGFDEKLRLDDVSSTSSLTDTKCVVSDTADSWMSVSQADLCDLHDAIPVIEVLTSILP